MKPICETEQDHIRGTYREGFLTHEVCVRCGANVGPLPRYNVDRWMDGLRSSLFADSSLVDPYFEAFEQQSREREFRGRAHFKNKWRQRNNPADALEEASDGNNYCMFDEALYPDADNTLLWVAGGSFYKGHKALQQHLAKRKGAP